MVPFRSAMSEGPVRALPVAVFVHGGAWKSSWSLDLADAMADDLAHRGWATWNMEYARCGHIDNDYEHDEGGAYPGTLLDVAATATRRSGRDIRACGWSRRHWGRASGGRRQRMVIFERAG